MSFTRQSSTQADDCINESKLWLILSSIFMTSFQEVLTNAAQILWELVEAKL
jgi:hypothetical protein